jgi:UDP-glucose/iron transport system permease protein
MPVINSMSVTGVVSLLGIMTGQILGGLPLAEAVKYQILVMFLQKNGTPQALLSSGIRLPADQ